MEVIQVLIVVFALFALSRAFLRFKDNKLTKNEFIFWALIWVFAIVISFIPNTLGAVSKWLGIGRGADLIIYVSIIIIFYLVFRLYVKLESAEKEITSVVRKIAIHGNDKKKK